MGKRQYTEDDKANALATLELNGGNLLKTASALKIPYMTLKDWSSGLGVTVAVTENREVKKQSIADSLEELCYKILGTVPDKLAEASFKDAMTGLGIAVDKMQVLRGEPNTINSHRTSSTHTERVEAVFALLTGGEDGGGLPGGGGDELPGQ